MIDKQTYTIRVNDFSIDIQIDHDNRIIVQGKEGYKVDLTELDPDRYSLLINKTSYSLTVEKKKNNLLIVNSNGKEYECIVEDERSKKIRNFIVESARTDGPIEITAPMPGMVTEIIVKEDEKINENQPLIVLEAMKMENEIISHCKGIVKKIHIIPAQAVEKGQLLVTIIP